MRKRATARKGPAKATPKKPATLVLQSIAFYELDYALLSHGYCRELDNARVFRTGEDTMSIIVRGETPIELSIVRFSELTEAVKKMAITAGEDLEAMGIDY